MIPAKSLAFTTPSHVAVRHRLAEAGILDLVRRVAEHHHVPLDLLLTRSRNGVRGTPSKSRALHACWRLLRATTNLSYPEIGSLFGGYDHTSVMYGVEASLRRNDAPMPPLLIELPEIPDLDVPIRTSG